jgi:hypothetical protein
MPSTPEPELPAKSLTSPSRGPYQRPDIGQASGAEQVETFHSTRTSSQSSPVKSRIIPSSISEVRTLSEAVNKDIDTDFAQNHLSEAPGRDVWWNDECDALVEELIGVGKGREVTMYAPLCKLLSGMSARIYGTLFFVLARNY